MLCRQPSSVCVTYVTLRCRQLAVVADTTAARPHNCFVPVKMDLCFQLVPQLVVLRTLHPTTQQLDLLDPARTSPSSVKEVMTTVDISGMA